MAWSYDPLWIQLIHKKMNRSQMKVKAGITCRALAQMGKEEPVSLVVIGKICKALNCRVEDVVEYIPDQE